MDKQPTWQPYWAGPFSIRIARAGALTPDTPAQLLALKHWLKSLCGKHIHNMVAAYQSLYLELTADIEIADQLFLRILELLPSFDGHTLTPIRGQHHQIPCWYDAEVGLDIPAILAEKELSLEQLIALHSTPIYQVYAVGFAPGFAYLGQVAAELRLPRLATPRLQVPAGAVAIAEQQTAMYPSASPGGWQLIGRVPAQFIGRHSAAWCQVGDTVQFVPIDAKQFEALGGEG